MSATDYEAMLKQQLDHMISLVAADPWNTSDADCELAGGWEFVKEIDGLRIYRMKSPDSPIYFMKSAVKITASPDACIGLAWDTPSRVRWDELFIKSNVVEGMRDDLQVEHTNFKSGSMLVSNRDFCIVRMRGDLPTGGKFLVAKSVPHEKCPEESGFVRGQVQTSGFLFRPNPANPNETYADYLVCVDPKGSIPTMIVNLVSVNAPKALGKLRDEIQKA
jgi:hypothetical protein